MLSPFVFQLMLLLLGACGLEGRAGLRLLTNSSCICPGQQIVFECVTVGPAIQFTVWRGSALDCSNGISLRHRQFRDTGYANATCNNGAVVARIVSSFHNSTTSQLIIHDNGLNFDGRGIQCSFDNGSIETVVGRESIDLMAAYPPPTNVRLVDVQPGQITFSWTPVDTLCQLLSYRIISSNCGRCPNITSHSIATCSDVAVTSEYACFFRLQTISCGNIVGNLSNITSLILRVPKVSAIISTPFYDYETRRLQRITLSFDALDQDSDHELLVSNFIDLKAHVTSYSITYLDMATGNICSEDADIPAGSCHGGVCRHVFDVSSSFCHPSTNITITVRTLTLLGAGPPSDPITIDVRNSVFDVNAFFDSKILIITCTYFNLVLDGERSCGVSFGLKQESVCNNNLSNSIISKDSTVNELQVLIDVSLQKQIVSELTCFVASISDGNYNAETGQLLTVNAGCKSDELGDGTALADDVQCSQLLFTVGIRDGFVCYSGTAIGSTAMYHCFKCGYNDPAHAQFTRTCLSNGTWSGTTPQCDCRTHSSCRYDIAISMGVVILCISTVMIIIAIILFIKSKQNFPLKTDSEENEEAGIYEDINLSQAIDSTINMAYESRSPE